MFLMIVEFRKGMKAKPAYLEIGSYRIDKYGNATVVGLQRTLGHYIDSFAFGSPLEIRRDNDAFHHIADQWVYPRVRVTDTIKRNGFKNSTYCIHPVTMFQQLLTNPKAEKLMKGGEIEVLRYLCYHPKEVDKYWNTIKVARRAGYKVAKAQMWFDYITMLDRIGKDLHSPTLVAPKDLKAAQDLYPAKAERQRIKEPREKDRKRAEADEAKFEELKGRYIGLVVTDGKPSARRPNGSQITIHTLNSVAEYYNEGSRQHICCGALAYYLKPETLMLTAKIGNKTIATIEIALADCRILQCRAFANGGSEYQERITKIISDNIKLIAECKTA